MQSILVTGADGQLGQAVRTIAKSYPDFRFVFTGRQELDITDFDLVKRLLATDKVDYCINAAAYTAVDKAESELERAFKVNADAVENLAAVCAGHNTVLLHVSTDFVFDGNQNRPYTEEDQPQPINAYGQSKLSGEVRAWQACEKLVVIRSGWLYAEQGSNFLNTILRLGKERDELRVVYDQIGTPTNVRDLAQCLMKMITDSDLSSKWGTYHFANEGVCSWYDFAVEIVQQAGLDSRVTPILTEGYPTPAERPRYSVLDKAKVKGTFGLDIPHWRSSLLKAISMRSQQTP